MSTPAAGPASSAAPQGCRTDGRKKRTPVDPRVLYRESDSVARWSLHPVPGGWHGRPCPDTVHPPGKRFGGPARRPMTKRL